MLLLGVLTTATGAWWGSAEPDLLTGRPESRAIALVVFGLACLLAVYLVAFRPQLARRAAARTEPRRWPILAVGVGLLGASAGWWLRSSPIFEPPDCVIPGFTDVVSRALSGPDEFDFPYCMRATVRLHLGNALLCVGAMAVVVGWWLGGPERVRALSRRLRVHPLALTASTLLLAVSAWLGFAVAWVSHVNAEDRAHREVAQRALAALSLPSSLRAGTPAFPCPGPAARCFSSPSPPQEVTRVLSRLLGGRLAEDCLPTSAELLCRRTVVGAVGDYPAVAFITRNLVRTKPGVMPPSGAVPYKGSFRLAYFYGSEVMIALSSPRQGP